MKECYDLLKKYHKKLTRQQILTLKGQIKKEDYLGFKKGLKRLLGGSKCLKQEKEELKKNVGI